MVYWGQLIIDETQIRTNNYLTWFQFWSTFMRIGANNVLILIHMGLINE